ncbi:uncharacterized protein MYCFIDRAFT_26948 [Pseudocercospora fijiensis CIRAD86]|uniref:FAD-binding PCMH-type domain-containing protein n=1 Tax=Pseudocercospora fijiensis (strain CIRAD86) TaxID=383855 RepID=N1Q8R2_PSEFD|nr:uncharacterized protein MYCFIDRAFT_26948 [Pseudocercospora fijiensis CIRAD86]EME88156.1 hypothetical protein MYCFIDRAFT_26948 [Pseudocercospora fijiensis CIRAD86]
MVFRKLTTLLFFGAALSQSTATVEKCRCIPEQPCWPAAAEWKAFNRSINGRLLVNAPVAISCYKGPRQDASECALITKHYSNNSFQQSFPVGYSYPLQPDCPLIPFGEEADVRCALGEAPVYTVNASEIEHVQSAVAWAKSANIRLVIRDTGHDLLGRSMGYGSLQVWIKYLRKGIDYHAQFDRGVNRKAATLWKGSAFTIRGGYTWADVYTEAAKRDLLVVGGGTPSVGCIGGWMQGGGHGPATHDFGLGADNVLSAKVVLANGTLVTASSVENKDLFFAIRGGGPGTYGVVIETTVKAYPTQKVFAQTLAIASLSGNTSSFLDTVADIYQGFPELAKSGWSGYGQWTTAAAVPFVANFTTSYTHAFANFRQPRKEAERAFDSITSKLVAKNGSDLFVSISYTETPDYAAFYSKFSGVEPPAGTYGATSGRFLDEQSLLLDRSALMKALETLAGTSKQQTTNVVEMFGAPYGQIGIDGKSHPLSGVNPAWREMIVHHIVARSWTQNTGSASIRRIQNDILYAKGGALQVLAPKTGGYMNENNRLDPDWKRDFYGAHYESLLGIKRLYDPADVFFCPTCVGSDRWEVMTESGQLCRTRAH